MGKCGKLEKHKDFIYMGLKLAVSCPFKTVI
jgi:hypothetical protein